ncbi:hypothetical protein C8J57DRAFT_1627728 [Mycena rebaudengoi]|nr:hypothetical protein C8J57DRAFT_1627728 [Mycena rebaudengoi]
MDFVKKFTEGHHDQKTEHGAHQETGHKTEGGGGFMDKINGAMGGGKQGEQKEDLLDKAVDFVQERMGGGDQSNESAIEQAKDEHISDAIRHGFKRRVPVLPSDAISHTHPILSFSVTGKDFPVKDKE